MFKQWGEWLPGKKDEWGNVEFCDQNFIPHNDWTKMQTFCVEEGYFAFRFGKKTAGRMLDGKEHMEFPV